MTDRYCLRCGSTKLQPGVIYDHFQVSREQLMVHWKSNSVFGGDAVLLHAIVCMSCGHTELVADLGIYAPSTRYECPHCKTVYAYYEKDEISPNVVRCQNCNKTFKIPAPKKCPLCGAVYLYSQEKIREGAITCQNCGNLFLIQDSTENDQLIDDIEAGLQEE